MYKNLKNLKFNLTPEMSLEFVKFNELKKELDKLYLEYNKSNDELILIKITKLEKRMDNCRSRFVDEFRFSNEKEIKEYLNMKDQD